VAVKAVTKVVFIGAGNLAWNLAPAMHSAGFEISQIYSRTRESAQNLAAKFLCNFTTRVENIFPEADIYIICVKDDAIKKLSSSLKLPGKLVIHTSGTVPLKAIEKISDFTGVLYPLQTFTKKKKVSFKKVPVFIEGSSVRTKAAVSKIARKLSDSVIAIKSEDRQKLHIAAVFACNFTNHFYHIAESLVKNAGLKFSFLYPLILETTLRTEKESPSKVQTGPAIRNDKKTLRRHLSLLKKNDAELAKIYKIITADIQRRAKPKSE
jgi:predicted short-subunit dehydrogenase-like oxidoreductase (DUF2520 family)